MIEISPERYALLMATDEKLSPTEIYYGWHFCNEFDGLLVGPTMGEWDICECWQDDRKIIEQRVEEYAFENWLKTFRGAAPKLLPVWVEEKLLTCWQAAAKWQRDIYEQRR